MNRYLIKVRTLISLISDHGTVEGGPSDHGTVKGGPSDHGTIKRGAFGSWKSQRATLRIFSSLTCIRWVFVSQRMNLWNREVVPVTMWGISNSEMQHIVVRTVRYNFKCCTKMVIVVNKRNHFSQGWIIVVHCPPRHVLLDLTFDVRVVITMLLGVTVDVYSRTVKFDEFMLWH